MSTIVSTCVGRWRFLEALRAEPLPSGAQQSFATAPCQGWENPQKTWVKDGLKYVGPTESIEMG